MGIQPSDTVTGPDAYGAAASPGTSDEYSRGDHNHGLPAASGGSLTVAYGSITSPVAVGTGTTTLAQTGFLDPGNWIIQAGFTVKTTAALNMDIVAAGLQGVASTNGQYYTAVSSPDSTVRYMHAGLLAYFLATARWYLVLRAQASAVGGSIGGPTPVLGGPWSAGYVLTKVG